MHRLAGAAVLAALLLMPAGPALADAVLDGNALLIEVIRATGLSPPQAARAFAMLNVAVFDSANAAGGMRYQPYSFEGMPAAGADPGEAAAAAAAGVIGGMFPDLARTSPPLAARLAALSPAGPARSRGIALGRACAEAVLAARKADGTAVVASVPAGTGAGAWRPTPPAYLPALLPGWGEVRPWGLPDAARFMPAGPPALGSVAWSDSFNAVRSLGTEGSADHTGEMTAIARFWEDEEGTDTPPGHWVGIASGIAARRGQGLVDNARLFALLGITLADVSIVVWKAKYHYATWRPITAIRETARVGGARLPADPDWTPVLATPPFPEYPSGHSAFSAAAARMLALFYGSDAIAVDVTSSGVKGAVRHFDRLSEAAEEAGLSRIYGGIHFYFSHVDGAATGRGVAEHVFATRLRPVK